MALTMASKVSWWREWIGAKRVLTTCGAQGWRGDEWEGSEQKNGEGSEQRRDQKVLE